MKKRSRVLPALLLVLAAACREMPVEPPVVPAAEDPSIQEPPNTLRILALDCAANVRSLNVTCGQPTLPDGISADLIVGGQNLYVALTSSNVTYNSGTGQFTFDATVKNLIPQPLGTLDGTTPAGSGVRVFLAEGPTVTGGTGSASVIPDGFGTFTSAGQPYYQYNEVLSQNQVSGAKTWTFVMPPTVTNFSFKVFVSAPVQWPDGYVSLDDRLPGESYGSLHPTSGHTLTAAIRTAVGNVVAGPVTWGTTDPACATVDAAGAVSGVRAGTCTITAEATLNGVPVSGGLAFTITGMTRTWNGSVSTDFEDGANWDLGVSPASSDSITVPAGAPNSPVLTASRGIGGVNVEDNATLGLASFDLTVGANLQTGYSAGSGVLATTGRLILNGANATVAGRVPSVLVTAPYSLAGDLYVIAPLQTDLAALFSDYHLIEVTSQ